MHVATVVASLLSCIQPSCDPMDCSPPVSSVHGISQESLLELVSISFSRRAFQPRDETCISYIGSRIFFYHWTIWEAPTYTHNKILKERGIQDHFTCLLWNLYAGQDATLRNRHGITDWFKIGEGVHQGCILSPCLFNFYAEYIMWNAGLEEAQARIKTARKNINNLRYLDDTTLMAESEEEVKSLLMRVKEDS